MKKLNVINTWRERLSDSNRLLIVDVESSGFSKTAQVLEIAVLDGTGRVLIDTRIFPGMDCPIDTQAARVHGLTHQVLKDAPTWPDIWPKVQKVMADALWIVAYNESFDRRIIKQTCKVYGMPMPNLPWYCAMKEYTEHVSKQCSLAVAAIQQSVQASQAHSARGDCETTLAIMRKVATSY